MQQAETLEGLIDANALLPRSFEERSDEESVPDRETP